MVAWTCLNGVRQEYNYDTEEWVKTNRNCIKEPFKKRFNKKDPEEEVLIDPTIITRPKKEFKLLTIEPIEKRR